MNKQQFLALIRALLISAGTTGLVSRGWLSNTGLEIIVGFIVAGIPVAWTMWAKSHASLAKQAVAIVNNAPNIVGDAATGSVKIVSPAAAAN